MTRSVASLPGLRTGRRIKKKKKLYKV